MADAIFHGEAHLSEPRGLPARIELYMPSIEFPIWYDRVLARLAEVERVLRRRRHGRCDHVLCLGLFEMVTTVSSIGFVVLREDSTEVPP